MSIFMSNAPASVGVKITDQSQLISDQSGHLLLDVSGNPSCLMITGEWNSTHPNGRETEHRNRSHFSCFSVSKICPTGLLLTLRS